MSLAFLLLLGTGLFLFFGFVVAASVFEKHHWQRTLIAFRLYLPRNLTVDDAAHWLGTIAAIMHPPRGSVFPLPPIALEALATHGGIAHYVLVPPSLRSTLVASVQANLPGARLEEDPAYREVHRRMTFAQEFTLTSRVRSLAVDRAASVSASLVAALQPLGSDERILIQLLVTSAGTPSPVPSTKQHTAGASPLWVGEVPPADATRAQRLKQRDPLLYATLRMGVAAANVQRGQELLAQPQRMVQGLNAPGVRLVRHFLPSLVVSRRVHARCYPLMYWPLLLNAREASILLALPFGAHLPGLALGKARQLPPPPAMPRYGNVVGVSDYPGMAGRTLALVAADRLRHVHLVGPTGTGKSTLLARMALQDIASGYGVVVIDPKGDLVADIAARVPVERRADVVILDPSETQSAIVGFNPLRAPSSDSNAAARELIADHVLTIFHSIYREFWGPRTDEILRAALFSLTHTDAPDGSAFTLIEVPELLTSPSLRRYVCAHPALPPYLRSFWQWFDGSLSDGERAQATGPVLNKLRAFSMRSNIRLVLGQSQGIALDDLFLRSGILLLSLAKGKIGHETANLLGSLFVAALWQATQARITLPAEERHPVFAYLDEFQDIVRLGADTGMADMLAQARGLGLSLTLAHQYLNQLPGPVKEATLGTVRTHIAFQLEWDDARALEARFAPLTSGDLSGLGTYEFALKPCVSGQTLAPVTGVTLPLDDPANDADEVARASREHYGMARPAIEAGLRTRLGLMDLMASGQVKRFGREFIGGNGGQA